MSRACIVSVGDELLSGAVADRNASYIAEYLSDHGIDVERLSIVGDEYQSILSELAASSARCDLLIVTGGLGPTSDDRTRDALSLMVGQPLEFDEELWENIQKSVGRTLSGSNRVQARRPLLFEPLLNPSGTAPGLVAEVGGCRVVALPGPPHELRAMFETHGSRLVESLGREAAEHTTLSLFGVPESRLEDALLSTSAAAPADNLNSLSWHTRAEAGRIVLRLVGASDSGRESVVNRLREVFGRESIEPGETWLGDVIVSELQVRGMTLAAAESCTGGLIGAAITDVPGSSEVFWGSLVTYANHAKETVLGVATLAENGAVSEETVSEMAKAVRKISGADIAVAVSGIAGPAGGTTDKPVGTVWVGLEGVNGVQTRLLTLSGDRRRVRLSAMIETLLMIRRKVCSLDSR